MGFISMTDRCDKCGHSPSEYDALRSRLAEVERERDEAREECEAWETGGRMAPLTIARVALEAQQTTERALAASQAREARLREAMRYMEAAFQLVLSNKPCTFVDEALSACDAALASAPGSTDALREVCMRVADHVAFFANTHPISKADAHTIVSRILGERSDDAPHGRGERGKEGGDA